MEYFFVPMWVRTWYIMNLLILIPDWMYIMLRPRSLEGGDLAHFFRLFNIYARVDTLFSDYKNKAVFFIYVLGCLDILACSCLSVTFTSYAASPTFALLCICREVFVFTKTVFYLMYSYDFIVPKWRGPIYLMNSQWVIFPLIVVMTVSRRISGAMNVVPFKPLVEEAMNGS